jgi:ATP-binding cassette subfamily C (CFTR/MRP) protein 1
VVAFVVLCALLAFFTGFPQKWLQLWAASYQNKSIATNNALYIGAYAAFAVSALLSLGTAIAYWLIYAVPRSASSLHLTLLQAVTRAPYSWLLMTNTGKTINRFSQDMSLVDVTLPIAAMQTVISALYCVGSLVFLVLGSIWLAFAIPIILGVLYVLQSVYLRTSRQLRLLDLEAKSPLYTHYGETIDGLATIRAYGWQHQYVNRGMAFLDHSQSPYYLLYCAQRWLNFVLDMTVAGIATLLVGIGFALRHSSTVNGGSIGVALVNIIGFNQSLALLVQNWTLLETSLGAIARISDLVANTPAESPGGETGGASELPQSAMEVQFRGVSAKASPESPNMILKNVNLIMSAGQKTALIGPSGSGKSSILLALTGLLHIDSGEISLDGRDITTFERDAVRQKIAVMSQDAPALPGTIQFNLDPLGFVKDPATIIAALAKVGLDVKLPDQKSIEAPFNQLNLSIGEMQLFRFAAVLLSNAKLVLLDEVTSNLDAVTERKIIKLVEEEFNDRTIIAVAHRLNTILEYDQVIVIDGGAVAEAGRPRELLKVESSRFARMYRV